MRSQSLNGVDIGFVLVVWARKEADSAVNQGEFVAVGIPFGRAKNGISEIVNENVVRIVSLGAVDDDGLKILVPAQRIAEEITQVAFAVNGIDGKVVNERISNIVENVIGIGVAEIIVESRPNVFGKLCFEFIHDIPPRNRKSPKHEAWGR